MNMRLFKGFFIVLLGLFAVVTIMSLFIPSKIMVTKGVVINADANKVLTEISDLQNWKHWQPVFMADTSNLSFSDEDNGSFKTCEWVSKGKKNKIVIKSQSKEGINVSLLRDGENEVLNTITVLPLQDSNQVQVDWNVLIKLKWYPWEKFYGIFIEKITGDGYEAALNSLKKYVEAN